MSGTPGVTADAGAHSQSPNTVSPTNPESPYGGNFPGAGVPFTNSNTNTTQSNNDILYDTMSQVYPALSSSLGMVKNKESGTKLSSTTEHIQTNFLLSRHNHILTLNKYFSFFNWICSGQQWWQWF